MCRIKVCRATEFKKGDDQFTGWDDCQPLRGGQAVVFDNLCMPDPVDDKKTIKVAVRKVAGPTFLDLRAYLDAL